MFEKSFINFSKIEVFKFNDIQFRNWAKIYLASGLYRDIHELPLILIDFSLLDLRDLLTLNYQEDALLYDKIILYGMTFVVRRNLYLVVLLEIILILSNGGERKSLSSNLSYLRSSVSW